jgi:hypothetical protein
MPEPSNDGVIQGSDLVSSVICWYPIPAFIIAQRHLMIVRLSMSMVPPTFSSRQSQLAFAHRFHQASD